MSDQSNIEDLLLATDKRVAYQNQLEFLKENFHSRATLIWNGHRLVVDLSLIQWANWALQEKEERDVDVVIILDQNNEPVLIDDILEFHHEVHGIFHEALNEYFEQYIKLKNAKTVKEIVGAV